MSPKIDNNNFELIFKEFFRPLVWHAYKYLSNIEQAKDIVHNAFVKVWEKKDELDTDKNIKSYLFAAVTNLCINYLRDNKKIVNIEQTPETRKKSDTPIDTVEYNELEEKIIRVLDKLPTKTKEIFLMSRNLEMKNQEIADKLNVSVKTVEAAITKTLKELKNSLKKI